jgi:hypothetical protein
MRFQNPQIEQRDVRVYSAIFNFTPGESVLPLAGIWEAPWENDLHAAYSTERELYIRSPFGGINKDWEAQIVLRLAKKTGENPRKWRFSGTAGRTPALGATNDGRYLILTQARRLLDTSTMQELDDPALPRMLSTAKTLGPLAQQHYSLTNNRNYLTVRLDSTDGSGNTTATIAGKTVDRGRVGVIINRGGNAVASFPIYRIAEDLPGSPEESYQDAGESDDGTLLLLYSAPAGPSDERRVTLRDKDLKQRFSFTVNPLNGKYSMCSWDPGMNRILFYATRPVFNNSVSEVAPSECLVWDYKHDTVFRFQADVFHGFELFGATFKPRPGGE